MLGGISSNRKVLLGGTLAAGILIAVAVIANSTAALAQMSSSMGMSNSDKPSVAYSEGRKAHDYKNGVYTVRAGGGGAIAPLTQFFPKVAEIKVGETVVWYNPTRVGEPHTVTFLTNMSNFADIVAPFSVSNSSNITPLVPGSNAGPVIIPGPGGKPAAIMANARSIMPVVIDKDGNVKNMAPNSNYTMTSDEKYVNSGWMWPKGQEPQGLPDNTMFSVKFEKAGTYSYLCAIHPWMSGQVVVK